MKLSMLENVRVVEMHTSEGVISVELYDRDAPRAADSFCRFAESGQLDGAKFERLVPGFVLECSTGEKRPYGRLLESAMNNRLHHTGAGILSFPNALDGCVAGERFYVTLGPQPRLDETCTIFGRIYSGMRVVEKISNFRFASETFCLYSPVEIVRCSVRMLRKEHRVAPSLAGPVSSYPELPQCFKTGKSLLETLE